MNAFAALLFASAVQFGSVVALHDEFFYDNVLAAGKPQPIPGLHIGVGYDVLHGNPKPRNGQDTGWREAVYQMDYSSKETTQDGLFAVPDGVDAQYQLSCSFDSVTRKVHGQTSYQASATEHVEITRKNRLIGASASASADFRRIAESTNSSSRIFQEASATCTFWYFQIEGFSPPKFTSNFEEMVRELAKSNQSDNQELVNKIIFHFGTHVSVKSVIGALFAIQSEFEQSTFFSKLELELDVEAAASVDLLIAAAGVSAATEKELELASLYDASRTRRHRVFVGSLPPKDGTWQSWAAAANQKPRPVKFVLEPLCDLINIPNFPNLTAAEVQRAHDALEDGIEQWCYVSGKGVENCEGPAPDPIYHKFRLQSVTAEHSATFQCRDGFQPISAGITARGPRYPKERATIRYALEVSDGISVMCAGEGITCTALCTSAFTNDGESPSPKANVRSERLAATGTIEPKGSGVQVATSSVRQGPSFARCSDGFKVASCGLIEHPTADGLDESSTIQAASAFPIDDKTCVCQERNLRSTSQCQATCVPASALSEYYIEQAAGQGIVTVECQPHMTLLGCGYRGSAAVESDAYWYAGPVSTRACQCKNSSGATCYSVCAVVRPAY